MNKAHATAHNLTPATPHGEKRQFVAELSLGTHVRAPFVLSSYESRIAANGSRYLAVVLRDRTGSVRGVEFDRASFGDIPPRRSVVFVEGVVEGTQRQKRVKIARMTPTTDYEAKDFIATSTRPLDEMSIEFGHRVKALKSMPYAALVKKVFHREGAYRQFIDAPLAESGSLAYRGAALERALKLCSLLDTLCEIYPQARRNLLQASALLAYAGAVDAFEVNAVISQTARGKNLALDHLSVRRVEQAIEGTHLEGAALAVETILLGGEGGEALVLEKELFSKARALLEGADIAQEQDASVRVVDL